MMAELVSEPRRPCPEGYAWVEPEDSLRADDVFFDGQEWKTAMRHQIGFQVGYPYCFARKVSA